MKKIPVSNPYCWLVIASSLFIVNAANVMLMRSRKATMYRTKMKGMILIRTFWIVLASMIIAVCVCLVGQAHLGVRSLPTERFYEQAWPAEPMHRFGKLYASRLR